MVHNLLGGYRFILASGSPRRMELLKQIGLNPEPYPAGIDEEIIDINTDPAKITIELAEAKLNKVKNLFLNESVAILGADTIVIVENEILGKPRDLIDARHHLELLSGRKHSVITGIAFYHSNSRKTHLHAETTDVFFKKLDAGEISWYLESGESMDKAGSYAIQGFASQFVESIHGCYFNVVGLPIPAFYDLVKGAFDGR